MKNNKRVKEEIKIKISPGGGGGGLINDEIDLLGYLKKCGNKVT